MQASVPLTGADCFLRAFDGEVRRLTGASHLSQLVLRLGPGFDPERLRAELASALAEAPILRAPIRRPRPFGRSGVRLARAAQAPPPVVEIAKDAGGARGPDGTRPIPPLFFERLNEVRAISRGELVRFDVVPYDGGAAGTDVAMTWLHMLFDGSGSERSCAGSMRASAAAPPARRFPAATGSAISRRRCWARAAAGRRRRGRRTCAESGHGRRARSPGPRAACGRRSPTTSRPSRPRRRRRSSRARRRRRASSRRCSSTSRPRSARTTPCSARAASTRAATSCRCP